MATTRQIDKRLSGATGLSGSLGATRTILRRQLWLWPILAALLLGIVGWWVNHSVERAMRDEMHDQLNTILNADVEALRAWIRDQEAITRSLAQLPSLRPKVQELLAIATRRDATVGALLESHAQSDLRSHLQPFLKNFGYIDYYIVSPSMEVLASKHASLVKSSLDGYRRSFFQQVLEGPARISKPYRATVLLPDMNGELRVGLPTMLAACTIPDENGKPLGVLALRLRPEAEFTQLLQTARFGESGETYVFSENGLLLSQSRFDSDLKRLGLLADLPDAQSILTVETRDPGVNLMEGKRSTLNRSEQPLTKLISSGVSGNDGVEMEPYNDYRGVPSVGACKWLPEYGFGVATEVDVADAFRPLYVLRKAIRCLFALLVLSAGAILFSMRLVARQRQRMKKVERTIKELGQYSLEEKIGSGGMGSVYRARHAFLRRPTAVKMLNTDMVTESTLARFEREVQLTSRLSHPNTIAVYDYGRTPDGVFYYAMEYLEGTDLEDLVKKFGPLPEGRVLNILQQICGSLAEAHEIGLIHRDIKPANIILTARAGIPDFVKVLDFGLVKTVDADELGKLTQANVTVGTPYYMSPEAVERPDTITALSDIYAIGAVGYYLLTGTPVFTGKTVMDICMKHVKAVPEAPSKRLGKPISTSVEALILRCLAKDPKERPPSTRDLLDELARCEPSQPWTRGDAEAWWSEFKNTTRSALDPSTTVIGQGGTADFTLTAGGETKPFAPSM